MENSEKVVSKEDVIGKLKDDGDFDRLRLKIVRNLKDNEELREQIASVVKQSAALNRGGAENMKPRQLSNAIYEEVGDKVMSQISNNLWQIIRSNDGMKSEITETVQSVYDKLVNPKGKDEVESSSSDGTLFQRQGDVTSAGEIHHTFHESEPKEPPGFTFSHNHLNNNIEDHMAHGEGSTAEEREESHLCAEDVTGNVSPGFSVDTEQNGQSTDEDPDVPPGFG